MNKTSIFAVIILLNINLAFAQFSGGDGTADEPYLIENCVDLQAIDDPTFLSARFLQTANIDCSGIANFNPIGDSANNFTGNYNGQNFIISNLTSNRPSENEVALFAVLSAASVANLKIEDSTFTGNFRTATLVGQARSSSQLSNVEVINTQVTGESQSAGLAGLLSGGSLAQQISVSGTVRAFSSNTGGVVGILTDNSTLVSDVLFRGSVTGEGFDGGIAGSFGSDSSISNAANYGAVIASASSITAGLVGAIFNKSAIDNSFNVGQTAPNANIVGFSNSEVTISNTYFSSTSSGSNVCVESSSGTTINTCDDVDSPSVQINYFRDSTNEPMASWDFADAWQNCDDGELNAFTLIGMCESSTLNSLTADFNSSQNLAVTLQTKNQLAANSRVRITFPDGKYDLTNAMLVGATAGELLAVKDDQLVISLNNASELAAAIDLSYELSGIAQANELVGGDMLTVNTVNLKTGAAVDSSEVAASTAPPADACPDDENKTEPGVCGCGVADDDTDKDGQLDCQETCPMDADKTEPGVCGCGTADTDSDSDSTADCNDMCPNDAAKVMPGACGCGTADSDEDNNEIADCRDEEPAFELGDKVLKRINRLDINSPKRRLFGSNKLINLIKPLDNPEIELLARRLKAVARRIRRSQNNGSLTSRELARLKRIAQRRISRLQAALQAAADS